MHEPPQWQIRTPLWVWCVTVLMLLLTSIILAHHNFVLFLSAALAFFIYCRRRVAHSLLMQGVLRFEAGRWTYVGHDGRACQVSLERVWPNGVWTTLRFSQEASGVNQSMELTVWKSRASEDAWRSLGILVAEHVALMGGARERT